jgi:hypothetical protein
MVEQLVQLSLQECKQTTTHQHMGISSKAFLVIIGL